MLRNEYGAIQQHLEPEHIRNLLVPVPDDIAHIEPIAETVKKSIQVKEQLDELNDRAIELFVSSLEAILDQSKATLQIE